MLQSTVLAQSLDGVSTSANDYLRHVSQTSQVYQSHDDRSELGISLLTEVSLSAKPFC